MRGRGGVAAAFVLVAMRLRLRVCFLRADLAAAAVLAPGLSAFQHAHVELKDH